MELHEYLEILRRRWLTATLVALTVLAAVSAVTLLMTPKFTATTRLFFAVQGTETVTDLAQGSTFAEKQIGSYAEVATSPLVLDPVIERLALDTSPQALAESITATVPTQTVILEIAVTDPNARTAARIANAVGAELSSVVRDLSPEPESGTQAVKATTLTPATVPATPSSPNVLRNLAVGLVLGLVLGIGAALLRNVLDTKIRSDQDVRALTDTPLLGSIAFDDAVPRHPVVVADEPLSAPSEAVRRLRTNMQFIGTAEGAKQVVITSSVPGEGKSTTSVNLAVALADAGSRVILIDADLRRPSVAKYMGLEGAAGLTTVLIGRAELGDVIQPWRSTGLDILPSGQVPPNPSELLGSKAMVDLLARLGQTYDVVLMDSPPLLPVTDATILAKIAGGALIVVGADRIHRRQLVEALATLETAGASTYGLVLNKVARRDARPYAYDVGYYSTRAVGDTSSSNGRAAEPAEATVRTAAGSSAATPGVGAGPVGRP